MRRRSTALLGCVAALALAGQVAAKPAEPALDRVLVRGTEFELVLSKAKVRPGRVIVQFLNDGEDPHDLRLQRRGDTSELGVGEIGPGEVASLDTRLRRRSTYALWCSLDGHREAGMEATLRTRKRRARID